MKKNLIILLICATVTPIVAQINSVMLHPTFDASVGYHTGFSTANNNYNNVPQMSAYSIPGAVSGENVNRALFGFDFSSIPAGSTIVSAYLSLYKNPGNSILSQHTIGNSQAFIQRINQPWNESTVTWNNQPTVTSNGQVSLAASQTGNEDYLNIDLTSLVQASYSDPSSNYGYLFRLQSEVPNRALIFCSNNYQEANKRPLLVVNYCVNNSPLTVTPLGTTSFCEGGSVQLSVNANGNFVWNDGSTQNPRTVTASGDYYVSSVTGCASSSNTVNVNVHANPAQPTITPNGPLSFYEGGSVTLQSSSASAYEWIPTGGNASSIQVSQSGSFSVKVYNDYQCSAISQAVTVTVLPIVEPPVNTACSAVEVISYNPLKRNDGSFLPASRSISSNALGAAQNSDSPTSEDVFNAVSLGFGGELTVRMSGKIANGEGNDLKVFETTFTPDAGNCNRYPERIQVFASQDNCNWVSLGSGCQDAEFDLGELNWAEYIRLIDISPIDGVYNNQVADGYDVDAIECLHGYTDSPVLQDLGANYAMQVVSTNQQLRRNGSPVTLARSDASKALGAPQNSNTVNFYALGFGGSITLKLGYVVFNKDGNDLQIVETSYGNPACSNYPEKANVEVSLDGSEWYDLGQICLDGGVDFLTQGINAVQYVRITDHSALSNFSASADGYDVDGIVVLQPGCQTSNTSARIEDDIWTKDETSLIFLSQTITKDLTTLQVISANEDESLSIQLVSMTGQKIKSSTLNVNANSSAQQLIDMSDLANGVYLLSVQGKSGIESFKIIKQ